MEVVYPEPSPNARQLHTDVSSGLEQFGTVCLNAHTPTRECGEKTNWRARRAQAEARIRKLHEVAILPTKRIVECRTKRH
jgi:hypothetical protein